MGPYLSRTPIRVHRVFRQGSSGPFGSRRDISATSAKVRSGPKTSNLVQNGSRIDRLARNKDQMNRIDCPDPSGPLLRPKRPKKKFFLRKTAPGGPGGPRRPPSLLSAQAGAYVKVGPAVTLRNPSVKVGLVKSRSLGCRLTVGSQLGASSTCRLLSLGLWLIFHRHSQHGRSGQGRPSQGRVAR